MAETKSMITGIVLIIVSIIIIFSFVGGSSSEMTGASDTITDANNCSEDTTSDSTSVALTYNITDKGCYNTSTAEIYTAGQYDLPLNTLFSSSGVVWLICMAALLIFIIGIVLMKKGFTK